MAAFFAFLHHLSAFTLFAALVVEFVLIRSVLTVETARKIQRADMIFGISAGVLLLVGLGRVFHFEKGAYYYFPYLDFHRQAVAVRDRRPDLDHPNDGVPALESGCEGGGGANCERRQDAVDPLDHSLRDGRNRSDHPPCRPDGQGHRLDALMVRAFARLCRGRAQR